MRSVCALPSNPPMPRGDLVEHGLAVVAERRVAEVVREARRVDDVGVTAERGAELATDLRHLERVGQAVAHEVVVTGREHLRLGGEPAQRRRVHDPRPVAGEVVAVGPLLGRVLRDPSLPVSTLVAHDRDSMRA